MMAVPIKVSANESNKLNNSVSKQNCDKLSRRQALKSDDSIFDSLSKQPREQQVKRKKTQFLGAATAVAVVEGKKVSLPECELSRGE
jgi:L-fucose isomerase-like protein